MTQVRDVMTLGVLSLSPRDTVLLAAQAMEQLNIGALPVCEGPRVVGVITDRDIVVRGVALELPMNTTPLSAVMSPQVECVFEDEGLAEVIAKMQQSQIRRLPVLDNAERLVGMLSLGDLALHADPAVTGITLADISEPDRPLATGGKAGGAA
ncbi:MAG: hypothetical protein A2W72_25005 [Burkholderiales bacterium RIFCSPLOWO2_12_67_14]|nr:MAG: hypothetical protein A3I64_06285 [Burkholderiales bacterium RIFCSPLOWO2_02_FULL_67_64]OGB44462.1 MAG: hypothetical protein A3E51_20620 [Burkholderiales bacterium RIFCSPHIGHO2_12_FULL_67_38]OGB50520.1 MAG: hypothetical protein A2W72_25005 [Burkholderiales bacterium RIFCSPLOWO2_12_67_14]OGB77434.1 MAG: hypothetical protein A3G82_18620 [Burkholderiales bacterium RIFCSPLOWO2_12_FULL_67_210]